MENRFEEFIKLVIEEKELSSFNYKVLRETEWKVTYLLVINENKYIVQIRKKIEFYEHVKEALEAWHKRNCKVNKLIYIKEEKEFIAYVFPYIEGVTAKEVLLDSYNDDEKKIVLDNIGKSVRELCNEDSNGYGWLTGTFKGNYNSWYKYLNDIISNNTENLLKICSYDQIDKLHRALSSYKNKLDKVRGKLLYVDINLGNFILNNNDILIIDYDYLISGDPLWVAALFSVLYYNFEEKDYFINAFLYSDDYIDKDMFELYKMINLILLLSNSNIESIEIERRKQLFLKLINNYYNISEEL